MIILIVIHALIDFFSSSQVLGETQSTALYPQNG